MKLPPKPKKIREQDGYPNPNEWDMWGRACAEAMREKAAYEANRRGAVDIATAIRNIKIEEE